MKASGPQHERETIIRFDDENDQADIWTASERVYKKLLKRGFEPIEDGDRHVCFRMQIARVFRPNQPRPLSQAQKENLDRLAKAGSEALKQKRAILKESTNDNSD